MTDGNYRQSNKWFWSEGYKLVITADKSSFYESTANDRLAQIHHLTIYAYQQTLPVINNRSEEVSDWYFEVLWNS